MLFRSGAVITGIFLVSLLAQARFFLPDNPVPITLQGFGVLMLGSVLGLRLGLLAAIGYYLVGMVGLPVFAKGGAGLGLSIEELFNEYERLKGSIPGEGTINSHRYLVETSVEYIGGMDELARIKAELERELKELESLIAETAEKEAAWTSYLAEMNNFVDTTQPYSRADSATNGIVMVGEIGGSEIGRAHV